MTMTTPSRPIGLPATLPRSAGLTLRDRAAGDASHRRPPLMRKVEVLHQAGPGSFDIADFTRIVPAVPAFEEAFSVFARGTILNTDRGQVAVEDVLPGDKIRTADAGFQPLRWRGSTIITTQAPRQDPAMGKLTRIAADALGIARPMPDLVLGPRARILHRSQGVRTLTGYEAAAIPARDFCDGVQVVELTPPTTVPVFHLGFDGHHRILASGVEVESFHPGPAHLFPLRGELLTLFLSCFPHVEALEDFGAPDIPRLRLSDLDLFDVA